MELKEIEMSPEIRGYLEDLLKDSNSMPESDELKEMMLIDLFTRLQSHMLLMLAKNLSDDQFQMYSKISEMDIAQGQVYLQDQLPNYQQLYLLSLAEFRDIFLGK